MQIYGKWKIIRNLKGENKTVMNKTRPLNLVRSIEDAMLNHSTNIQNKSIQKGSILDHLMKFAASVPDFRRCNKGNIRHRLNDIIILMILGRTCRHIGRADIIAFGRHNQNKFRKMGMLKNGDTFGGYPLPDRERY